MLKYVTQTSEGGEGFRSYQQQRQGFAATLWHTVQLNCTHVLVESLKEFHMKLTSCTKVYVSSSEIQMSDILVMCYFNRKQCIHICDQI